VTTCEVSGCYQKPPSPGLPAAADAAETNAGSAPAHWSRRTLRYAGAAPPPLMVLVASITVDTALLAQAKRSARSPSISQYKSGVRSANRHFPYGQNRWRPLSETITTRDVLLIGWSGCAL
ncbi:hypothetical protein, partial [Pseudomonas aeruginosa]|uniref:hypothetical protein n=1 Tax=Pseudomonas aeruginosa TaxID=287 RepID=UPI00255AB2C2